MTGKRITAKKRAGKSGIPYNASLGAVLSRHLLAEDSFLHKMMIL
ncbi:MAG: hypothetical protein WBB19_00445 [Desulforhopalus sp.]